MTLRAQAINKKNDQLINHCSRFSLRGLRVFMKICLYASSTGYFLTDFNVPILMDALVFRKSSFLGICLFSPWHFYTTIAANILFIYSVFFSIYNSRLFLYSQRRQQRLIISLLLAQSFSQLSLAISISSFKYPFYTLKVLTSFSSNSPLFFYMMHWLESSVFSQILNSSKFFFSPSQFLMKDKALNNCLFFILCLSSSSTISRLRCSSDSLQVFISLSSCCTYCRLFLNSFSPISRLLTFSDRRSRSILLMGENSSSPLLQEGVAFSKQMG